MATSGKINCYDMYGKVHKVDAKKVTFRPSVYGILIVNHKILLQKYLDGYDFPGGGAKIYESIEDALKREFWEETGFKIKPIRLVHAGSFFRYCLDINKAYNIQYFYFLVKKISGRLSKGNFDANEKKYADMAEWINLHRINKIIFYNDLYNQGSIKLIKKVTQEKL